MRSEWVNNDVFKLIFAALTPANMLVCETSIETGLRVGDVLALKADKLRNSARFVVKEEKTGKSRIVYIPKNLRERLLAQAGRFWVFENRTNPRKHRTRQAVFKDLRRAAKAFRIAEHISPHSLRKAYAVAYFNKTGDMKKVQKLLNHSSEAVTFIYAMADKIKAKQKRVDKKKIV